MESLTNKTEPVGVDGILKLCQDAAPLIFNFNYSYFNPLDKDSFQIQFLMHYCMYEIGYETYGWWKIRLQDRLEELYFKYLNLYKIEQLEYNPYDTVNMQKIIEGKNVETGENKNDQTNTTVGETKSVTKSTSGDQYSDTPQGSLSNVQQGIYLTDYRYIQDDDNTTNNNSSTDTIKATLNTSNTINKNSTEKWSGKEGGTSYAEIKMREREAIININRMFIDEFEQLFMGVF